MIWMGQKQKIDVLLICGFLGAGKTTLLLNLLEFFPDIKIGVIENEFGEVNIDGDLVQRRAGSKISLIEITNGSMFCSCRHADLIEALRQMSKYPLDLLILESTGIADPSPFKRDIQAVNKLENNIYRFAGSICVVDGTTFLELLDMLEAIRRQIAYSDLILINKADVVKPYEMGRIRFKISNINPKAQIEYTTYCKVPRGHVMELFAQKLNPKFAESVNTTENKPQKLSLSADKPILKDLLRDFLDHVSDHIFRLKGFCKVGGTETFEWFYLDGVKNKISMEKDLPPLPLAVRSEIVVILKKGDPYGEIILEAWKAVSAS